MGAGRTGAGLIRFLAGSSPPTILSPESFRLLPRGEFDHNSVAEPSSGPVFGKLALFPALPPTAVAPTARAFICNTSSQCWSTANQKLSIFRPCWLTRCGRKRRCAVALMTPPQPSVALISSACSAKKPPLRYAANLFRRRLETYLDKVFGFSSLVSALPEGRQFPQHSWKKVFDAVFLSAAMQILSGVNYFSLSPRGSVARSRCRR